MKHQSKEKATLRRRLQRAFCQATGTHSRIEMESNRAMIVQGCCGIDGYEPSCIVLRLRDPALQQLHVFGEALLCNTYHEDAVQIVGRIWRVELCRTVQNGQRDFDSERGR